ncbi:membrane integrity-associated transporter subunit PqiC [Tateyamaria sp. SN6-1]|uniref:PqiC family protein n=1 Tax=Tateyamaria sp. SN6-1 TaxID=3092148 RepID=UPI0039F591A6
MKLFLAVATAIVLSACTSEPPLRFNAAPEATSERVRIAYQTVSVREVELPIYAATEEISRQSADGSVSSDTANLWADDPARAITLDLARTLRDISGARVAPDPWPFQTRPEVVVDVRFEELVPSANGQYRATGLYFVAPDDEGRAEHAHAFDLSVTFDPEAGFESVAASRTKLVTMLALDIARTALR